MFSALSNKLAGLDLATFSEKVESHWLTCSKHRHPAPGLFSCEWYLTPWASAEIFPEGAASTLCLSFSGCWRCNAIGRSQNALPFPNHKKHVTATLTKTRFVGSNSQVLYITIIYTKGYCRFSKRSSSFQRSIAMVLIEQKKLCHSL